MDPLTMMAISGGLSAAANVGGSLISSGGQAAANAENVRMQNMINQQTLNAQQASHEQNTAFMEDSQNFNREMYGYSERFNSAQAEIARNFNRDMVRETNATQMAFQERMAGTQYQRAMADMKAAGLNPLLAYKMGGNAAPAGAGGTATSPAASASGGGGGMASAQGAPSLRSPTVLNNQDVIGRALGNMVSTALDLTKTAADIDYVKKETEVGEQRRLKTKFEADSAMRQAEIMKREVTDVDKHGSKYTPQTHERLLRRLQEVLTNNPAPWNRPSEVPQAEPYDPDKHGLPSTE